ncbi:arginine/agmatine antiporter [Dyella caseinilytica]|uniref:Arginine/agmatine antiporter n=1 Tax=Dyella caseinilytica TaxID=1849581 RepID=A0ABX7GXR4_9GAMM|nr:arginine/agmatine antiporter [Dyella caseinilytica]QRN55285.1 arginine/agmatine antiporter [Dyella caseinilytica]GGA00721.1 arginine/agmatine antiporter [Dyella caseinilytica]
MADEKRKIGVVAATFLVAGNMMGSGVFLLPGSLAKIGTVSMWGWVVTTIGSLLLAFVFAKLGRLAPKAGGPYAYARDAFGPYMGFQTNTIYWFANWIGNVALPVAAVGYFSFFVPALSEPLMRTVVVIALIWLFTLANIMGAQVVTRIQSITTSFALVPLFGIAIFGWFFFKSDIFAGAHNVSGGSDFHAISSAASLTLWAFIGVESASVSAAVVKNPEKNVAIATLAGVAMAAVVYISSSAVIMGMIPNDQLQVADAPFALAAQVAVGKIGGGIVSLCATLGAAGSLGGWIMLTALSAKAAGDDGLFPRIFSKANKDDTPVPGLIIVAVLMSLVVLVTAASPSASEQFELITQAAVVLTLLPYIYSSVACYFVIENSHSTIHTGFYWVLTSVTVVYCLWAIFGTTGQLVAYAFLFMLFITVFYPFFSEQRRRERAAKAGSKAAT